MNTYRDRFEAGRVLVTRLTKYQNREDVLVLALPRGGVPVGFEVAQALKAPLDVFLVRKLGVPGHEELAMGAIASGGARVLNAEVVHGLNIPPDVIEKVAVAEQRELERREKEYRDELPPPEVVGRNVILVDDGLATGSSMRAAVQALYRRQPARVVVAVPTAPPETCTELESEVDEIICAMTPEPFYGVGFWYQEFSQTSDREVRELLQRATREHSLVGSRG